MAKIIVLDDNEILLSTICDVLSHQGHKVKGIIAPSKLRPILSNEYFDLLITDIIMPEQEGMEIILEIRQRFPVMKILAISGKHLEDLDILDIASQLGAHATLEKPFSNEQLISIVNSLLGKSHAN